MLLNSGVFGDEKETTELFSKVKAKYVPTTAADILETDDESAFLDAKKSRMTRKRPKTYENIEKELMPGCTLMFDLNAPHGKMTAKYVGPVIRNGKVDEKGWTKVILSDGDAKTHAQLIDKKATLNSQIKLLI